MRARVDYRLAAFASVPSAFPLISCASRAYVAKSMIDAAQPFTRRRAKCYTLRADYSSRYFRTYLPARQCNMFEFTYRLSIIANES